MWIEWTRLVNTSSDKMSFISFTLSRHLAILFCSGLFYSFTYVFPFMPSSSRKIILKRYMAARTSRGRQRLLSSPSLRLNKIHLLKFFLTIDSSYFCRHHAIELLSTDIKCPMLPMKNEEPTNKLFGCDAIVNIL